MQAEPNSQTDPQVLIAGAGPTGLALALWLVKLGVKIRIVDKAALPGTTSAPSRSTLVRWSFIARLACAAHG